jgi:hypothetical protein
MLESSADDHITNGSSNELFQEPFLAFLIHKVTRKVLSLMGKLYPCIGLQNFPDIFQLIVGRDLIELVQLSL